jgi:DNA mismatch endonuclease (patch repair protein)
MDRLDRQARSRLMSKVRGKNTQPELAVRAYLHSIGLRFRLHDANLPGRPDLIFKARRVIVFVHGCFWHGHKGCSKARVPKTRAAFWRSKMETNAARDRRSIRKLRSMGWRVFVVWQCEISEQRLMQLGRRIAAAESPAVPSQRRTRHDVARTESLSNE